MRVQETAATAVRRCTARNSNPSAVLTAAMVVAVAASCSSWTHKFTPCWTSTSIPMSSHPRVSRARVAIVTALPATISIDARAGRHGGARRERPDAGRHGRCGYPVRSGARGRGGLGNAALASRARKAPGFALLGEKGQTRDLTLELKTVADVGLIGFPSAGKSSLVSTISAAKPKIADYPFTTLVPNLGVVSAGENTFTVADVPGLIPGASKAEAWAWNSFGTLSAARCWCMSSTACDHGTRA